MKKLFLFLMFIVLPFTLSSQSVSVVETRLPDNVFFATPFETNLLFSHEPGETLSLNTQMPDNNFEITSHEITPSSPGTTALHLNVMPFTLAASTFTVTLDVAHGTDVSTYTVEIPLTVQPVQLFKDNHFHEIRDPKVPVSWLMWLFVLACIILVLRIIAYLRKKTEQDDGPAWQKFGPEEDKRPCHEIALSKINALIDSGLWERKEYKLFYSTLFDILREYLWRRFHLDTSADTSAELLRNAKKEEGLTSSLQDLKDFLTSGDLVKFAKMVPTETERNHDITYLQAIIKRTTPPPPNEEEKTA